MDGDSNQDKVRIGMLGAGKMALWHLRAYRGIRNAEVAAICNPKSDRGPKLAKKFAIENHFRSPGDLLSLPHLDAVDICTPTGSHKELICKALEKGLHVYVEKPMCGSIEEAEEIVSLNMVKKRIIVVGFNYRFCREFMRIKEILQSGDLGEVHFFLIVRGTVVSRDYHIFDPQSFSGTINEFSSTSVDLLRWWGYRDVELAYTEGTNVFHDTPRPDSVCINIRFSGGVSAVLINTYAMPSLAAEIMVFGSRKMLRLKYGKIIVQKLPEKWSIPLLLWMTMRESFIVPYRILYNPLKGACGHFVDCVANGRMSFLNEVEGRDNVRVTSLLYDSYRAAATVPFPSGASGRDNPPFSKYR